MPAVKQILLTVTSQGGSLPPLWMVHCGAVIKEKGIEIALKALFEY